MGECDLRLQRALHILCCPYNSRVGAEPDARDDKARDPCVRRSWLQGDHSARYVRNIIQQQHIERVVLLELNFVSIAALHDPSLAKSTLCLSL